MVEQSAFKRPGRVALASNDSNIIRYRDVGTSSSQVAVVALTVGFISSI